MNTPCRLSSRPASRWGENLGLEGDTVLLFLHPLTHQDWFTKDLIAFSLFWFRTKFWTPNIKKNEAWLRKKAQYFDMEGCVPFKRYCAFFCKWLNVESVHTRDGWDLYACAIIPIVRGRKALWEVVKIPDPLSRSEVIVLIKSILRNWIF